MPKFSIIIPVYNVAPYLRECLDSVLAQTNADWECICIDDGSTDASATVLEKYASQDARFRVIRQTNGGVAHARQVGLDAAQGEFVGWVDPDDWIEPRHFQTMLEKIELEHADMVWGGYVLEEDLAKTVCQMSCVEDARAMAEGILSGKVMGTLCAKVYRRSAIVASGANFGGGKCAIMEDAYFLLGLLCTGARIAKVNDSSYHYVRRKGSLTNRVPTRDWWRRALCANEAICRLVANRVDERILRQRISRYKNMMYWNPHVPNEMVYGYHPEIRWLDKRAVGRKIRFVFALGGIVRMVILWVRGGKSC